MKSAEQQILLKKFMELGFDMSTQKRLSLRLEEGITASKITKKHNYSDFWKLSLNEDLQTDPSALDPDSYEQVYVELYKLSQYRQGPLLPQHTKMYLINNHNQTPLLLLSVDNIYSLKEFFKQKNYSKDELKELQLLSAFHGADKCFEYLTNHFKFSIDDEVLNMAILSGKYLHASLARFTQETTPNFNSIRYAIKSEQLALVKELVENYELKPESSHLTTAASLPHPDIFHYLVGIGVKPEGNQVMETAMKHNSSQVIQQLVDDFNYKDPNKHDLIP